MADQAAIHAQHATLVATVVDTITFSGSGGDVRVRNRSTTADIYFTLDGETPTVLGDDNYYAGPGESVIVATQQKVIKLISAGAAAYSVELY